MIEFRNRERDTIVEIFNQRSWQFAWFGLSALFVGVLVPALILGQAPKNDEILRAVLSAYDARQERMNPIWFRFKVSYRGPAASRRPSDQKTLFSDSQTEAEGEFARKGVKTRSWVNHLGAKRDSQPRGENFLIYNGEVQIHPSNRENEFMLSKHAKEMQVVESPLSMTGERSFHDALKNWAVGKTKIDRLSVLEQKANGGEKALLLDITFGSGWRGKNLVLPERDYFLIQGITLDKRGDLVDKFEVLDFETHKGLTFPTRGRNTHFRPGGVLERIVEFEVTSLETEAGKIPDSLFQFDLPKGASVWDDDLKVLVRNTELAQSHLDEVVRRAGTPNWLWRNWLWLVGGAAAIVSLGVFVVAKRWRKGLKRL